MDLSQFYGTEHWHRYSPQLFRNVLLTDGAKHVAEEAGAYWLMDMISSHLPSVRKTYDTFAVALLTKEGVNAPGAAFSLQDDIPATKVYATQTIEYTDFPLDEIKFYVSYDGKDWTILLPSEY